MTSSSVSNALAPIVYVVDDDEAIRSAVSDLLRSVDITSSEHPNTQDFLLAKPHAPFGCILLDVRLPGVNGLDFQLQLEKNGISLPVVFMTGYGDISMSVRAMKAGAVDFLTKPFLEQDVLDAVNSAFAISRDRQQKETTISSLAARYDTLTPREREVMHEVVKGRMNKQVAFNLGISEITVKIHRGNMMRKMEAKSVVELVKQCEILWPDRHHTSV
ncbi:response regulator [Agrobacterium tumefaciens]|uniref:response regulator transcription factor n=1 Tax=Agrobacterium tumefaciens TaxID=358 RepID=UPI00287CCE0F|nr:response regulator [Agrobacterium tumefaciens]MDS7595405.1 response regulator [Agrobacterium tumefaciens]